MNEAKTELSGPDIANGIELPTQPTQGKSHDHEPGRPSARNQERQTEHIALYKGAGLKNMAR